MKPPETTDRTVTPGLEDHPLPQDAESAHARAAGRFRELLALVARLRAPGGCPWDREQTHASIKPMAIEEAYEVATAIDEGDDRELAAELGDLLLQVVFHSQIAAEENRFTIADVLTTLADKLIRRHPHVFAAEEADTPEEVLRNWEAIKAAEREERGQPKASGSMLDSVSKSLPAVMEAYQMTTKVSRVGFDWPDAEGALAKLDEERGELGQATAAQPPDRRLVEEEIGDLFFAAVNAARLLGVDPESALKAANRKFRSRFGHVEARLRQRGRTPTQSTLAEMDELWEESKRAGRSPAPAAAGDATAPDRTGA